jgi:hypothetical protein
MHHASARIPCAAARPVTARILAAFVLSLALSLTLLVPPGAALARGTMQGGIWLLGALPQGEFKDNVEKNGFGIGGSFGYRIPESPVCLGAEFDFAVYGQARYDASYYLGELPVRVRVRVQTDNSIMEGLLKLRLQPPAGVIRPYVDGLFGFNYLATTTTITDWRYDEEVASDTNQDDTALAWGGGGGIMIRLSDRGPEPGMGGLRAILLDLRARYLVGGEAKYLKEGTIHVVDGRLVEDLRQSKTDLVTVGVGVTFEF